MFRKLNSVMFDNVGSKIKTVSKIFVWINIICNLLGGLFMMIVGILAFPAVGFLLILAPILTALSCFFSWLTVVFYYIWGEMAESTSNTDRKMSLLIAKVSNLEKKIPAPTEEPKP